MAEIEKPSRWANVTGIEKNVENMRVSNRDDRRRSHNRDRDRDNVPAPVVRNSRAAMLGDAPDVRPQVRKVEKLTMKEFKIIYFEIYQFTPFQF